ncbi:hypothetical protein AXG93_3037s1100 [Marchantia polymorpha subsp. ruderalis]|uniref:Uncharacterized protein n=1 Tax=Marchantia polymorpha subsp. ruderalis TaxID=1480154 RepID=A0A176WL46_MARPO|nr:hypothetical protein AXG93_3037s1100 [Marchantia polymorpha subsp. ruderalis]
MKAMRLIQEDDSSTESRRAASRGHHVNEVGPAMMAARGKEKSVREKPRVIEERSTPVKPQRASKKDNGKAVLIEEVLLRQNEVPSEGIRMKVPRERAFEVLLLLQYLDRKREKYADGCINESYVEIVRNRTRTKVLVAAEVAAKERKSQPTEASYQALRKRLVEEVEKRIQSEQVGEGLREDVERANCASVDLLSKPEACRTAYDAESLKVDKLSIAAKKKEQEYQIELAVRAKKLIEYESAQISDLELIEKLEAQCGELRTQRSQAEEKLCDVEAKLTEAEWKNRELLEETRHVLIARVERCLRGYVLWQIKSQRTSVTRD